MPRYLVSFSDGAMDHIPDEDLPAVAKAAHAVVQEALNAGVYLFAGGLEFQRPSVVDTDGQYPQTKELSGGFTLVDVPTREAAVEWAAKMAVAWHEEARAHDGLGDCQHASGETGLAREHWQQAAALYTELELPEAGEARAKIVGTAAARGSARHRLTG